MATKVPFLLNLFSSSTKKCHFHLIVFLLKLHLLTRLACFCDHAPNQSHQPIIVISFDGYRFDYFQRTNTTNMDYLANGGVKVPYMRNQFVTKTFPNHQSIITGLHTESHGIIDSQYYDPEYNRTFSVKDGELYWNYDSRVVPLWTLNEWSGHHSGVMMWPGSETGYGPNKTLPSKFVKWNESYSFEWRVDTVTDWLTDKELPVNLVFMYFEEPDELAHAYGPESPEVQNQISRVDNITGYLIAKLKEAGLFEKTNIMILSDHGFYEVEESKIINITSVVDESLYEKVGHSPVIQLRPKDDTKVEEIYAKFKNASLLNDHYSVYKKDDLPIHWHLRNNRRVMPIILVAEIGYVFNDFYADIAYYNEKYNFTPNASRTFGVHGYDNKYNPMHAIFLARGPAFFKISPEAAEPFDNVDLFPLICYLIGLETPPNNGSLANVRKLIIKHGFDFRSPILVWVIGAAVLLGLVILFPILSMMIVKRRNLVSTTQDDNSYRVKFNKENFQEILADDDDEIEIKSCGKNNVQNCQDDSPQYEENTALLACFEDL